MIDLEQIKNVNTIKGVFFGVCHEDANTAAKTVVVPGYTPSEGPLLIVRFENGVDPVLNNTLNVNGSGALYLETGCLDYDQEGNSLYSFIQPGTYAVFTYYYIASDDQGYRLLLSNYTAIDVLYYLYQLLLGKQDELVGEGVGQNIRTVNGKSLLGSGDAEPGDTLCYCIENSGDTTSSVVAMDVAHPSGFAPRNGSLIIAHFYSSVPAAAALTITGTALQNLFIVYHNVGITAGVINAGDNALILCYNNVAYVLTIDRQGGGVSTLAALTDTAVSSPSAWQGLVYNTALSKWVNGGVLHAYRSYEHLVTANTGTLQLVCAAGESAHHTVTVDPSLQVAPSISINLQNYNDNCIVIMQGQGITYYPLTLLINGVQAGIVAKYGDGLGIMDNGGTTIIYTKARNVMISLRAVDATTPYVLSECFEIEVTPIT